MDRPYLLFFFVGRRAADYVSKNLHENIIQNAYFHKDIARAIKEGFLATEEGFLALAKQNNYGDGTTAIVAFISDHGQRLTVGNIGDSEAVLCRGGKVRSRKDFYLCCRILMQIISYILRRWC